MRFGVIFDQKRHQNDSQMTLKWRPKRAQNASKNDIEKTDAKMRSKVAPKGLCSSLTGLISGPRASPKLLAKAKSAKKRSSEELSG